MADIRDIRTFDDCISYALLVPATRSTNKRRWIPHAELRTASRKFIDSVGAEKFDETTIDIRCKIF
jgi:hypothetical protein